MRYDVDSQSQPADCHQNIMRGAHNLVAIWTCKGADVVTAI